MTNNSNKGGTQIPKNVSQEKIRKQTLPSIVPGKVDLGFLSMEREKMIKTKLNTRLKELATLPSDFPDEMKRHAEIEMSQIRLVEYQKQLRQEILGEIKRLVYNETTNDKQL
jgi:hypothetical protein